MTTVSEIRTPPRDAELPRAYGTIAAVAVTVIAWASAFVAIRGVRHAFDPGALALGRLLVGSVALGAVVLVRRRRRRELQQLEFDRLCLLPQSGRIPLRIQCRVPDGGQRRRGARAIHLDPDSRGVRRTWASRPSPSECARRQPRLTSIRLLSRADAGPSPAGRSGGDDPWLPELGFLCRRSLARVGGRRCSDM